MPTAPATTEMPALLKQWAELEPERCMDDSGFGLGEWYDLPLNNDDPRSESVEANDLTNGAWIIERAVREAIAARGWDWGKSKFARVITSERHIWQGYDGTDQDFTRALLQAYLEALRAINDRR